MIESMTAYGSTEFGYGSKVISIEIRSVNHRYFDLRIKSPGELLKFENEIRKTLKDKLDRGSIDCFIRVKSSSQNSSNQSKKLSVDWELLAQYIKSLKDIKNKQKIKGIVDIADVIRLKDVFILDEADEIGKDLLPMLIKNLSKCTDNVIEMQQKEGLALKSVMLETLSKIEAHTQTIEKKTVNSYKEHFEKIKEKISLLLETPQISQDRIVTEAGILAERKDISEEIDRLHSHISQFRHELELPTTSIGKKLDFIVQEINRETNTIASKSEDKDVVYMAIENKTLTEKIREQVQNVK